MASPQIKRMLQQQLDITDRGLLLTPKYEEWLTLHGGEFVLSESEARRFGDLLADHLSRKGRVRSASLSASSAGYCERAQVFGFIGVPQRARGDSLLSLIFIDGKMKHLVFQFIGLEAGALTSIEHPVFKDAYDKYRLRGSIDGVDEHNGVGLELKSTQAFYYYIANGVSDMHKKQVHRYYLARDDVDLFCVIYLDTTTREFKEFPLPRDKKVMAEVINELGRLNDAIDNEELPEVLDECKNGKGKTFHDCGYSHVCLGCRSYEEAEGWVSVSITEAKDQADTNRIEERKNRPSRYKRKAAGESAAGVSGGRRVAIRRKAGA